MDFEKAIVLKTGQIVKNCFGEKFVVYKVDYSINFDNKQKQCYVQTIDSRTNKTWLSYNDIYLDNDDICDEEKYFLNWIKDNEEYVRENYDYLDILRFCFLQGFSKGYDYNKCTFKEMMEK